MGSSKEFADYVCDQLTAAGNISCKKMFGEYGVYLDEKIVGLICDNQFFLKKKSYKYVTLHYLALFIAFII